MARSRPLKRGRKIDVRLILCAKIVQGESKEKRKRQFYFFFAEPQPILEVADFVVLAVEVGTVEHDAEVAEVEGYGAVGVREELFPSLALAVRPKVDDYEHTAFSKMGEQEVGGFGPGRVGYNHVDCRGGCVVGVGVPLCVAASGLEVGLEGIVGGYAEEQGVCGPLVVCKTEK